MRAMLGSVHEAAVTFARQAGDDRSSRRLGDNPAAACPCTPGPPANRPSPTREEKATRTMSGHGFHVHGPHDHELEHAAQHGAKDSFAGTIAVMTAIDQFQ